jgi:hypothetical protein
MAVALLPACRGIEQAAAPDGVFLPRLQEGTDTYPAALITGTLHETSGCIFLTPDEDGINVPDVLLIWPRGTTAERMSDGTLRIEVPDHPVIQSGDNVALGGGFVGESRGDVGQAQTLIGTDIPDSCRTGGGYWITPGPT